MTAEILKQELKSQFQAGYPAVFIQSGEEARVDALLKELCDELQWHAMEWNLGYGWVKFANKQPLAETTDCTDLASCLPRLLDDDLTNKLIIIKDARLALESQDLAVARLKQLLNRIERHHRGQTTVVLVSESQFIPPALEAQTSLLHLPLPSQQEIAEILRVEYHGVAVKLAPRLAATCSGLTLAEIHLVLSRVGQKLNVLDEGALDTIHKEKAQIISKSGVLEMVKVTEGPDDIGGLENLKAWLHRRASIIERLSEAKAAGVQPPKGVLIAGMPGCGKSLTAKAAAGLFKLPLLRLDIGSLLGKYVGESEHNMRRALRLAESVSPCVLWIDELEKAFVGMGGGGSEVSSRLFGYFLTWMQEKSGAVFVIATANDISALPPELLRKGRFDEVFYVGFPNKEERKAILSIHLKKDWNDLSLEEQNTLIVESRDFAGSDIQNAVNEARENAFLSDVRINFEHLSSALKSTIPLRETLKSKVNDYENKFEELKLKSSSLTSGLTIAQMIKQANDHNPLRRIDVASNIECTPDLFNKLYLDPDHTVRVAVLKNPACPQSILAQELALPANDKRYKHETFVLSCIHPNAPIDLLLVELKKFEDRDGFVNDKYFSDLISCEHLSCAVQIEAVRIAKDINDFGSLLKNNKLHPDAIYQLLERHYSYNKGLYSSSLTQIAKNCTLNLESQRLLIRRENADFKEILAGNPSTSKEVQLELLKEVDVYTNDTVILCGNPSIDASALEVIIAGINEADESFRVIKYSNTLGKRHNSISYLEKRLELKYHACIPEELLRNPSIPKNLIAALARLQNNEVNKYLLENPSLSLDAYELLKAG